MMCHVSVTDGPFRNHIGKMISRTTEYTRVQLPFGELEVPNKDCSIFMDWKKACMEILHAVSNCEGIVYDNAWDIPESIKRYILIELDDFYVRKNNDLVRNSEGQVDSSR